MKHQNLDITHCQFVTERMKILNWRNELENDDLKSALFNELSNLLVLEVTKSLPLPLQNVQSKKDILNWVNSRNDESDVFCVRNKETHELFGLLIIVDTSATSNQMALRIGYLLNRDCWGRGIATELIKGFIDWCYLSGIKGEVFGGVEITNKASAKVLTKCGFALLIDQSNGDHALYRLQL